MQFHLASFRNPKPRVPDKHGDWLGSRLEVLNAFPWWCPLTYLGFMKLLIVSVPGDELPVLPSS